MELTEEQRAVVEIAEGRHLVLAPPGSGKTEMLTQRVVAALKRGVPPDKMFCVTFTVRAGVEMRERVAAAVAADPELKGRQIPDIGNIHHFCNLLLMRNRLVPDGKRVVDEIAQRELVKDVWLQLKKELRARIKRPEDSSDPQAQQMLLALYSEEKEVEDAVNVLEGFKANKPSGMIDRDYYAGLLALMESIENGYARKKRTVYPDLVVAAARDYRQSRNIPYSLLRPIPEGLRELRQSGLLSAISRAYAKLKDRFGALDFDDLITESYLALKAERVMREENRFEWIQVDEVQDLNALQWEIVQMVSRHDATSVFFGDAEQTIFSFMGASAERLARVAASSTVHYFRKNFRATPYLLDILVRYSLKVLRSKWLFLPRPSETAPEKGELHCGPGGLSAAVDMALKWIDRGLTSDVAFLVRRNKDADQLEQIIKSRAREIRYVKVSGVEIFELPAMRDFISFCTLLNEGGSLLSWGRMFRRFSGIKQDHIARRLVKNLVDNGLPPQEFLRKPEHGQTFTPWMNERLEAIRDRFSWLWNESEKLLDGPATYKDLFDRFDNVCWQGKVFDVLDYVTLDEKNQYEQDESMREGHKVRMPLHVAHERFLLRTEKLFRYLEKKRALAVEADPASAQKPLREIMKAEWREILQLREADLIVGDEQLVISTIHKAKGRQFGGVIIPFCQRGVFPSAFATTPEAIDEEARILYVGLSRAKRHLALFHDRNKEPSPFVECIRPCFANGFVNVFKRLVGADAMSSPTPTSTDWLERYNDLLEAGFAGRCPTAEVRKILEGDDVGDEDLVLRRIALSTVCHATDAAWRDACYKAALSRVPRTPEEVDVVAEALKGVGRLRLTRFVADNTIRSLFLNSFFSPMKDEVHFAILGCYESLLTRRDLTLDDALGDRPIEGAADSVREAIKVGVEDALFSDNGDVRMEAFRILQGEFRDRRAAANGLDGSVNDWKQLRAFVSEPRKRVLQWMLRSDRHSLPEGPWRDQILLLAGEPASDSSENLLRKFFRSVCGRK